MQDKDKSRSDSVRGWEIKSNLVKRESIKGMNETQTKKVLILDKNAELQKPM